MKKYTLFLFAIFALAAFTACNKDKELKKNKELTLSIIKPDAVSKNSIGPIVAKLEASGLKVSAIKMKKLSANEASEFYKVHKDKPFYNDLVNFMSSGPIVVIALEGDDAIMKNRAIMGATDPMRAGAGTIRRDFAESMTRNAVHGSDSKEAANNEILFFFEPSELQERF